MAARIRSRLVPLLDAEFPSWRNAVRGAASAQAETARFIAEEASRAVVWRDAAGDAGTLLTDEGPFFAADPVVRAEALYRAPMRLVGGCALVPGIEDAIAAHAGMVVRRRRRPRDAVVSGLCHRLASPEPAEAGERQRIA
jgi:hypothetical protein